jgi:DNA-directed RNA polymerase specialized sigma54-like protein
MGAKGDVRMCPNLVLEQVQQIQLTPEVRIGVQIMAMSVLDLRALMMGAAMQNRGSAP